MEKANILDTYLSGGYRKVKYYSINYDQMKHLGIHLLAPNLFIKDYILKEFEVILKEAVNQFISEGPDIHIVDNQSMNALPKQSALH